MAITQQPQGHQAKAVNMATRQPFDEPALQRHEAAPHVECQNFVRISHNKQILLSKVSS
jgi:hypothetical protein